MLGTDGMHSDMLQSAKAAYFVGQRFDPISPATAYRRFRNVHHYLADNGFRGDGANNLVVLNYNPPTEINRDNFYGHFIFGINASHVQHVISNGKAIVLDQKMTTVDEDEIMSQSREQAKRLWNLMKRL
jgi:cytosine/adenosine deaminase-related metal-dependent hydrolase